MTLINIKAVTSYGRRKRSYSEAQAIHTNTKTNSSYNHSHSDIATVTTATPKAPNQNKTNCTKKHQHRHHHRHQHQGNRLRSKSLDLHGIHKKKCPHQYKHVLSTHSPGGHHYVGSTSPSVPKEPTSLLLTGNLWIRPAATTAIRDHVPLFPAIVGVPTSPSPKEQQWGGGQGLVDLSPSGGAAPARHLSNDSSHCPAWLDNETVPCAPPGSSFGPYPPSPGPAGIIFGESGKPIKSRWVFGQYAP